ncbi:MAG: hypothetical protein WAV21_02730 [Minisyncoccia bacterium]
MRKAKHPVGAFCDEAYLRFFELFFFVVFFTDFFATFFFAAFFFAIDLNDEN